jgi:CDGSH-type Zn-finger protein
MPNVLQPQVDGPLKVEGEIEIFAADGALLRKGTRFWLCRCGQSATKPFCDSTHRKNAFTDRAQVPSDYAPKSLDPGTSGATLRLTLRASGPIRCFGEMQITDGVGQRVWSGAQASLCRCGASKSKPFCDGSHRETGFEAA